MKTEIENYIEKLLRLNQENLVIDERLKDINRNIRFVIIGDNPGKREKDNNVYFYEKAFAGKFAKSFVNLLTKTFCKKEEIIFLNKTPYYSDRTQKLTANKNVEKSIDYIIELINTLLKTNEVKLLIVGIDNNDLNNLFYPKLNESVNNIENLFFGKHFSGGHFHLSFLDSMTHELNESKIDILKSLETMSYETRKIINKRHKTNF